MPERVRLQKFLSQAGIASRRRGEELIRAGRVRVNGDLVRQPGCSVAPAADIVEVDGRRVVSAVPIWIAVNKRRGYVTSRMDPRGRPTVYDLLPEAHSALFHVGRLDFESEGLLLLTNEGDLANRLLHPRYGVDRVYEVEVVGTPDAHAIRRLLEGVDIDGTPAFARAVKRVGEKEPGIGRLRVTVREGRKRVIRRLLAAVGHPVRRLVRVRFGPIRLGRLSAGEWRNLSAKERASLERLPRRRT